MTFFQKDNPLHVWLCYNFVMKIFSKILLIFALFIGNAAFSEQYKVLVLPVDIFTVCENYYCFEEPSTIIANDTINYLNKNGRITALNLYDVRNQLNGNPQLKNAATYSLNKYKNSNSIDFASLKKLSDGFDAKSILLISSQVGKRSIWEVLEVSSVFEAVNQYSLDTNAVLLDNVNDIVMWSGKYTRNLGDSESRYWAKSASQAVSQYEKIKCYSKDIISTSIAQNIIQRFYPKSIKQIIPKVKPQTTDFRPNPLENIKIQPEKDSGEIQSETIYSL